MSTTIESEVRRQNIDDPEYDAYLHRIQQRFLSRPGPLFTTGADGLFEAYLAALPVDQRQFHTCNACRHFVERFGHLVTIDETGKTRSALWSAEDAPSLYQPPIASMIRIVERARVTGVHFSSLPVWGNPVTGPWRHLSVTPATPFKHAILAANEAAAEKSQDFKTMITAINEFTVDTVTQAVTLLKTDSLYRSEKVLGVAEWLLQRVNERASTRHQLVRDNLLWRAVATAPAGFCHPRSSMAGSLLEDISAGMAFGDVSRRFAAKMHPLQYQRPQAAPSVGNIEQAEKIIEQMGLAAALRRRYARLDEIEAFWMPTPIAAPKAEGVFGHLKPAAAPAPTMVIPPIAITWEKFKRTVLPEAREIDYFVPHGLTSFIGIVTAADPEAPPILQWDRPERRNSVSWYFHHHGSLAHQWRVTPGFCKVNAIALAPPLWHGSTLDLWPFAFFVIDGARETINSNLCLFPETLRSELHSIRSTIEAYSRGKQIEDADTGSANGIAVQHRSTLNSRVRVTTAASTLEYLIDRWD